MNDFPQRKMVKPGQSVQIRIDSRTMKKINCGKCGCKVFIQAYQVVKVPATDPANPTGKELLVEDGLLRCVSCGRSRKLQEIEKKENEE